MLGSSKKRRQRRAIMRAIVCATACATAMLLAGGCRSNQSQNQDENADSPRSPSGRAPSRGGRAASGTSKSPDLGADGYNLDAPIRPDARLTPGDVLEVTPRDFCTPGYSKKVRNVPASVKKKAYASYNIATREPGEYEVDHLISLQLGGSNSIRNLWPQSFKTQPWNARVKDALENRLHDLICDGKADAATVQREVARDWIAAYKKYIGDSPKPAAQSDDEGDDEGDTQGGAVADIGSGQARVWVNLGSGKYFFEGSRYFGKTKRGAFMTEAQAKSQGHDAAGGQ